MHKISKTGPEYADHRLDQEGAGFFLPQGRLLLAESGLCNLRFSSRWSVRFREKRPHNVTIGAQLGR